MVLASAQALALLEQYNIPISSSIRQDIHTNPKGLIAELERFNLEDYSDEIKTSLLKIIVDYYEAGVLPEHRDFLDKHLFNKMLAGVTWNEHQVNIIPFLLQNKIKLKVFQQILADEAYYKAVFILINLGLTEDVFILLSDPLKEETLRAIHALPEETHQKIALVFWFKTSLSTASLQTLMVMLQKYPLLAETLLALDRSQTYTIDDLYHLALNPKAQQIQSIMYYFPKVIRVSKEFYATLLDALTDQELTYLIQSFQILEHADCVDSAYYELAIEAGPTGILFRLFLSSLSNIEDLENKKYLIHFLYIGCTRGVLSQGILLSQIRNKNLLKQATELHKHFLCTYHMQLLGFNRDFLSFTAEETLNSHIFCQIETLVETKLALIDQSLNSPQWHLEKQRYRERLYAFVYKTLAEGEEHMDLQINQISEDILRVTDQEAHFSLHNLISFILNIVASLLNCTRLNQSSQHRRTYSFFYHSETSESLRVLNKDVVTSLESFRPEYLSDLF